MGTQYLFRHSLRCLLDDVDLFVGQVVEFVDELVDLSVGGVDLALEEGLLMVRPRRLKALVQVEHPLNQGDHLIVSICILGF